jgi:hypothetical protein
MLKTITAPFIGLLYVLFLPAIGILCIPYIIFMLIKKLFTKKEAT